MKSKIKSFFKSAHGQSMAEFGIALPILLTVIFGLLEVGRAVFMYAAATNASREAVRFATAYGVNEDNVLNYQNCAEIKNVARRVGFYLPLEDDDIVIGYEEVVDPDGTPHSGDEYFPPPDSPNIGTCDGTADGVDDGVDETIELVCGNRVTVTVTLDYQPMLSILPIKDQTFSNSSARTYLGIVELVDDAPECN